jgi:hypothetical protein
MRHVEEPDRLSYRGVFGENPVVLDRHFPAPKIGESRPKALVEIMERRLRQEVSSSG